MLVLGASAVQAQTTAPIVLPNTYSTVAGGVTTATTAGQPCVAGSRYNAIDNYGNGCPATQSLLGQDLHQGVSVDADGNIWINDSNNFTTGASVSMLRKVDARTGIITSVLSSGNSNCTTGTTTALGSTDSFGDGCVFANSKHSKERGISVDPYGNVIIGGLSSGIVRVVCNAVSPLCPVGAGVSQTYSSALKQVGYAYRIAGCVLSGGAASGATGTTAGTAGDGYYASAYWNLPGDVSAWNTAGNPTGFTGTVAASAEGTAGASCATNEGALSAPGSGSRAVAADRYGNVFINDGSNLRIRIVVGPASFTLPNGTVLTNPWPAIIALNPTYSAFTAAQMYGRIFPILAGFTATVAGSPCPASSGVNAKDTSGDNCPWYNTSQTSGNPIGLAISNSGDLLAMDGTLKLLRVLYVGPTVAASGLTSASNPMAYAISKNNSTLTTITQGNVYVLAGGGASGQSNSSLTLGTSTILANGSSRVAVGPNGNIFIGSGNNSLAALVGFYDLSTGYIRTIAASSGGTNNAALSVDGANISAFFCATGGVGDGLPAYTSSGVTTNGCFQDNGTGSGTLGIAVDAQNNLYIADSEPQSTGGNISQTRIRKVLASQLFGTNVGSTTTQTLRIHSAAGTTAGTTTVAAATLDTPAGISVAAPACTASLNADTTEDCFATATFAPAQPGLLGGSLALTPTGASVTAGTAPIYGIANGTAYVADPNSTQVSSATAAVSSLGTLGGSVTPKTLALDSTGDAFTIDTTAAKFTQISSGGTVTQLGGTVPSNPNQIALDPAGNLYAVGSSSTTVTELPLTATGYGSSSSSITIYDPASNSGATLLPRAVTFDMSGNMFMATGTAVYEVPFATLNNTANPFFVQPNAAIASGFNSINNLAIDGFGNLFISDKGATVVYRIDGKSGAQTTVASVAATAIAVDTAGNAYYQAGTSITAVPFSGASTTVLSSLTTPAGLAVSNNGNVYSVDSGTSPAAVTVVNRSTGLTYNFGTVAFGSTGTTIGLTVNNAGNIAGTGYIATNAAEFQLATGASNGCGSLPNSTNGNTTSTALAAGAGCTLTATFVPANGTSTVSSTNSLALAALSTGSFSLSGTEAGATAPTTTTGITGATSVVYASSGTEDTFTITVTASNSGVLTGGTVNVSIDGGATTPYALNSSNQATVTVSALIVGPHTISATFPSQAISSQSYGTSTSGNYGFSVTQASTVIAWTPSTTTQQYSSALSNGVLNATATSNSASVPGIYVYTATPTGGSASVVHAATYLPIGTYSLAVTFYPADAVDFAQSTSSVSSYSVTKASTTAGIGTSQTVVASDGSGNFTSVQSAVNSIPASGGGSVYIKPGTYTGNVLVVQPNVAIRGLGGDPTAVVLTHSAGAFGSSTPGVQSYAGADFGSAQLVGLQGTQVPAGSTQYIGDPGSSTLLVEAGINTAVGGSSLVPNNFYAENFTVVNTYDSSTTNTTTTYLPGSNTGVCTANQGPARTYNDLFNNGLLCASQAIAISTQGDLGVFNNIYATSLQDTLQADSAGTGAVARQYYFRGKYTGTTDYLFGNAAAVFDYVSIYTVPHGSGVSGSATIHAQQKSHQAGLAGDTLSGYVMNSDVFTSYTTGMTGMEFGRPYGPFSTYIMINSLVDQVNPSGYIAFGSQNPLTNATYTEYNDQTYTDPTPGSPDANGVIYSGLGGNSGAGVLGTRENVSTNPGTLMASNNPPTSMTLPQAATYFPAAFLGSTVATSPSGVANWNHTAAIAAAANAFVPSGSSATVAGGTSVTILLRPQTPGLGAVTNGTYTIPTGTYVLSDTYNGVTSTLASGSLDASGEAYFTSNALNAGTHSLSWTYSGDSNFSGSTASAYTLTVSGTSTATTLGATTNPITYGQTAAITATVSAGVGTPTGTVTLTIDGTTTQTATLSGGVASFNVTGLLAGTHNFTANYGGSSGFVNSNSSTLQLTVNKATVTVTASCSNRTFGQQNSCSAQVGTLQNGDTVGTVFTATPTGTSTATPTSPAGNYTATPVATLSTFGTANYTLTPVNGSFTVSGGAPQSIIFAPLPNFPHGGSYQLTARTTSGLPVSYAVITGSATVSGSTLTVTGTGLVTVQALQSTDPTGDYAAATPVSRSFTAP